MWEGTLVSRKQSRPVKARFPTRGRFPYWYHLSVLGIASLLFPLLCSNALKPWQILYKYNLLAKLVRGLISGSQKPLAA